MRKLTNFALIALLYLAAPAAAQTLDVYPGAMMVLDDEDDEEMCCSYASRDPLEKVLAFYEARLGTKALDPAALGAKYPALRPQLEMMQQHMPPGMEFRMFILEETGGRPERTFEVVAGGGLVHFTIEHDPYDEASRAHLVEFIRKKRGISPAPKPADAVPLEVRMPIESERITAQSISSVLARWQAMNEETARILADDDPAYTALMECEERFAETPEAMAGAPYEVMQAVCAPWQVELDDESAGPNDHFYLIREKVRAYLAARDAGESESDLIRQLLQPDEIRVIEANLARLQEVVQRDEELIEARAGR